MRHAIISTLVVFSQYCWQFGGEHFSQLANWPHTLEWRKKALEMILKSTGERSPAVLVWKVQPTPLDATLKSNRSSGRYARAARGTFHWLANTHRDYRRPSGNFCKNDQGKVEVPPSWVRRKSVAFRWVRKTAPPCDSEGTSNYGSRLVQQTTRNDKQTVGVKINSIKEMHSSNNFK